MKGWKPSPQSQENFTSFPANWQRVVGVMIHSQGGWGAYVHEKRVDHHHWVGFVRLDILTCVSPDTASPFVHD